jgi:hypothetical protein
MTGSILRSTSAACVAPSIRTAPSVLLTEHLLKPRFDKMKHVFAFLCHLLSKDSAEPAGGDKWLVVN